MQRPSESENPSQSSKVKKSSWQDNKDVSLGKEEQRAWQLWEEKVKQFKKRRQQGAGPIFTAEMEVLGHVLAGI